VRIIIDYNNPNSETAGRGAGIELGRAEAAVGRALSYLLPANIFLFAVSGSAYVQIDDRKYYLKKHHLLHAGKGMGMDIMPAKHEFSFYLIYYKATLPAVAVGSAVNRLLAELRAFDKVYPIILPEPGSVHSLIRRMYEKWRQSGVLVQIRMKSMLYEMIYEQQRQFDERRQLRASGGQRCQFRFRYRQSEFRVILRNSSVQA